MGSGFARKKKEAKKMQEEFLQVRDSMQNEVVQGTAGGGRVQIDLSGQYEMKSVRIDPKCLDPNDVEGLETLIQVAYQDAVSKLESKLSQFAPPTKGLFSR